MKSIKSLVRGIPSGDEYINERIILQDLKTFAKIWTNVFNRPF